MACCQSCYTTLYRCQTCDRVGCTKEGCRNQQFSGGNCTTCNGTHKKPVQ